MTRAKKVVLGLVSFACMGIYGFIEFYPIYYYNPEPATPGCGVFCGGDVPWFPHQFSWVYDPRFIALLTLTSLITGFLVAKNSHGFLRGLGFFWVAIISLIFLQQLLLYLIGLSGL